MILDAKTLFGGGRDEEDDDGVEFIPIPQGRGGRGGFPGGGIPGGGRGGRGGFPGGGFPGGDDDDELVDVIVQDEQGHVRRMRVPRSAIPPGTPGLPPPGGGRGVPGGGIPGRGRGIPGGGRGRGFPFPGGDDEGGHPLRSTRVPMKLDKSLKELFNAEVKQAVKDYAAILDGTFLFVNVPENQIITEHVTADKTEFRTEEELVRYAKIIANEANKAGSSLALPDPQTGSRTMIFTPLPFRLFTTQDQPYEMEAMATFYHELGHLVAPNASGSPTLAMPENVADVYGILRHIQKYGDDSKAVEVGSWSRAWRFVLTAQADHFTTLSIDAMPKILEKLDVSAMTPQQTAHLASRIALQNTPHVDVMENVAGAFKNVLPTILRTGDLEAGLRELADTTLASDQAYFTFRIGSSALNRFLDGKVSLDNETQLQLFGKKLFDYNGPIELDGAYWDGIRTKMRERTAQLEKEGVLLGMPHKGEPKKVQQDNKPAPRFGKILGG